MIHDDVFSEPLILHRVPQCGTDVHKCRQLRKFSIQNVELNRRTVEVKAFSDLLGQVWLSFVPRGIHTSVLQV